MSSYIQQRLSSVQQHDPQGLQTISTQVFVENEPQNEDAYELAPEDYQTLLEGLAPRLATDSYPRRYRGPGWVADADGVLQPPAAPAPYGQHGLLYVAPRDRFASEGLELLPACLASLGGAMSLLDHPRVVSDVRTLGKMVDLGGHPDYNWFEWHPTRYNMYTANNGLRREDLTAANADSIFGVSAIGILLTPYATVHSRTNPSVLEYQGPVKLPTVAIRGKTAVLNFNHEGIPANTPVWLDYPTAEEITHLKTGRRDPLSRRDMLGQAGQTKIPFLPWVPVTMAQYVARHGRNSNIMPPIVHNRMYFGVNMRDAKPYEAMQVVIGKPAGPGGLEIM